MLNAIQNNKGNAAVLGLLLPLVNRMIEMAFQQENWLWIEALLCNGYLRLLRSFVPEKLLVMPTVRQKPLLAVPPPAPVEQDADGAQSDATPASAAGGTAAQKASEAPRTSSSTPSGAGAGGAGEPKKTAKGADDGADERVKNSEELVTILEGFEEALSSVGSGELFTILYSLMDAVFYKP